MAFRRVNDEWRLSDNPSKVKEGDCATDRRINIPRITVPGFFGDGSRQALRDARGNRFH
jgi:hypothetical protein